jgi:mRNA interferase YafQ
MLVLKTTGRFKKDLKRAAKQGKDIDDLQYAVDLLQSGKSLSASYFDHALTAGWKGHRECHIEPDWLLIYRIQSNELVLVRTGTHAELFGP